MNDFLPDGWEEVELGIIADWSSGGTPGSKERRYYNGSVPWLIISDLNDSEVSTYQKTISQEGLEESNAKIVAKGSVLISIFGSIGKLGIAAMECATNQAIAFTQTIYGGVLNYYLFYTLLWMRPLIIELGKGGAQKNINLRILKDIIIPIAPLPEQQRIVTAIEERMQQVEQSQQQFRKLKQELQQYRQDVLISAVSGQLTENWREDNFDIEPADELLDRLIEERIRLYQEQVETAKEEGKPKPRAPKFDTSEIDVITEYEVPDSWLWTRLLNVADISGGVAKGKDFKRQTTISLPYLRVANVQDGYFDLSDVKTIEILPEEKEKYLLREGDILFTEGGDRDKLGRGAIWQTEISECIHQNHVFKARTLPGFVLPEYISLFTKTEVAKKHFFANATQSINLSSISMTTLGNTPVALPPTEEQREILKRVAEQMSAADALEKSYDEAIAEVEALPQIILAKSFAGELTEQDPNDEPASVLLERIRVEREAIRNAPKPEKDKTPRPKKMAEPKLLDVIQQTFASRSFTFDELRQKTTKGYEALRDELYGLIETDKKLIHQFDPTTATLTFSLTADANPTN